MQGERFRHKSDGQSKQSGPTNRSGRRTTSPGARQRLYVVAPQRLGGTGEAADPIRSFGTCAKSVRPLTPLQRPGNKERITLATVSL